MIQSFLRASLGLIFCLAGHAAAQSLGSTFANDYSLLTLGGPPGVPWGVKGMVFDPRDPNLLLIAAGGDIYSSPVTRDANGRISGFGASATVYASAPEADAGLAFGPDGVLFVTTYPSNRILQYLPGSTAPDKTIDLGTLGVASSVGACAFVPGGFNGARRLKVASYTVGTFYELDLAPDGQGTYDIVLATLTATPGQGPAGIAYIPGGNPGFANDAVLVTQLWQGAARVFDIDATGNPIVGTERDLITGGGNLYGGAVDPLTGDLVFKLHSFGNRVFLVRGFSAPAVHCAGTETSLGCVPSVTWSGTASLSGPDDFRLTAHDVLPGAAGLLVLSPTAGATPFGPGQLCFSGAIRRFPVQVSADSGSSLSGCSTYTFSDAIPQAWLMQQGWAPGTTIFGQYVSRDGGFAPPNNLSLSDGVRFTILP